MAVHSVQLKTVTVMSDSLEWLLHTLLASALKYSPYFTHREVNTVKVFHIFYKDVWGE